MAEWVDQPAAEKNHVLGLPVDGPLAEQVHRWLAGLEIAEWGMAVEALEISDLEIAAQVSRRFEH